MNLPRSGPMTANGSPALWSNQKPNQICLAVGVIRMCILRGQKKYRVGFAPGKGGSWDLGKTLNAQRGGMGCGVVGTEESVSVF
jgi:hypothetical protein